MDNEVQEELSNLLCLDHNYKNLLLIKKIIKILEELSHNTELREKAGFLSEINIPNADEDVFVIHPDEE